MTDKKYNKEAILNQKINLKRKKRLNDCGWMFNESDEEKLISDLENMGFPKQKDTYIKAAQHPIIQNFIDKKDFLIYPLLSKYENLLHSIFKGIKWDLKLNDSKPLILLGDIEFLHNNSDENNIFGNNIVVDSFGIYIPVINIIVIDTEKILKSIQDNQVKTSFSIFFEKVLLHELGHWFSHEASINGDIWNDDEFFESSSEVKEFWAQYLSFLMMDDELRSFQKYFAKTYQTKPYQRYLEAVDKDRLQVLDLLKERKKLNWSDLSSKIKSIINIY